jgi:hypothetical protein
LTEAKGNQSDKKQRKEKRGKINKNKGRKCRTAE